MLLNFASIEMAKYHIVPDRIDIQIYPTTCRQTFFSDLYSSSSRSGCIIIINIISISSSSCSNDILIYPTVCRPFFLILYRSRRSSSSSDSSGRSCSSSCCSVDILLYPTVCDKLFFSFIAVVMVVVVIKAIIISIILMIRLV